MANDPEFEERIRKRAFSIWLAEGQPDGRDRQHWELAKFAISEEDGQSSTLAPSREPASDSIVQVAKTDASGRIPAPMVIAAVIGLCVASLVFMAYTYTSARKR